MFVLGEKEKIEENGLNDGSIMGWVNVNRSVSPITTDEVGGPKLVKRKVEPRVVWLLKVGPKPNSPVVVSVTV